VSRRLAAVPLLVTLLPFPGLAAPKPKAAAPVYYHPTREGDTRVYTTRTGGSTGEIVDRVEKVEATADLVKVTTARAVPVGLTIRTTLDVSAAGVTRLPRTGSDREDPFPLLKLPAKVGDRWSPTDGLTYRVAAVDEAVEVPAGKYKAVRVEVDFEGAPVPVRQTFWYAPGVGLMKETGEFNGETREVALKSFTPGK
jgi:hypothetical protein